MANTRYLRKSRISTAATPERLSLPFMIVFLPSSLITGPVILPKISASMLYLPALKNCARHLVMKRTIKRLESPMMR